jgi:hypothetical protein
VLCGCGSPHPFLLLFFLVSFFWGYGGFQDMAPITGIVESFQYLLKWFQLGEKCLLFL